MLNCILGYKIQFFTKPILTDKPTAPILNKDYNMHDVDVAIQKLLNCKAIVKCASVKDEFISSYFLVKKSDGSFRFVLNLKKLNQFIHTEHFKIEDGRTVVNLLSRGDFLATIDLESAYFLVPIHEESRKYLRFIFKEQMFEFVCLPFGLNVAPYVFTKILKPVMSFLRVQGFRSVIYLDDILCLGDSKVNCSENINATVKLLVSLGFLLQKRKCDLVSSQTKEFLGLIYDSNKMIVTLPENKKEKVLKMISIFQKLKRCKIRSFASFVGLIESCCRAAQYGRLYTKNFERAKYLALKTSNNNYESEMTLSADLQTDFVWWANNIPNIFKPIELDSFDHVLFTDACLSGWGAFCEGERANGFWAKTESILHINYLELKAVLLALKWYAKDWRNCKVLLRIDNTTAMAYVNKMGGVQYPELNKLAREIWQFCESKHIWLFASYIKSEENVEADRESRIKNIDTEWELADYAFRNVTKSLGTPVIDLFASRINKKCERYFAWKNDPEAVAIDAFTYSWRNLGLFWAFPPFALIAKLLRKVIADEATGIIIAPNWPNQPWFPMLNSLLISEKIILKPSPNLLLSPCRSIRHHLAGSLSLIAGVISGARSKSEVYQRNP